MNILLFLTPKQEVTLLYEDYTIGQALRSMENGGHPAVPIIRRSGEYVGTVTEGDLLWYIRKTGLSFEVAETLPLQNVPHSRDNKPVLASMQNNRDHRKLLIIDGKVAFTGGVNLADEYINRKTSLEKLGTLRPAFKKDGTVTAGMSGSNEGKAYRFWAGATTPDNAPFRVDKKGEVYATNAHITGEVNATSGTFSDVSIKGTLRTPWKTLSYKVIYRDANIDIMGWDGSGVDNDKIRILADIYTNGELQLSWGDDADGRDMAIWVLSGQNGFGSVTTKVPLGKSIISETGLTILDSYKFTSNRVYYLTGFTDFWLIRDIKEIKT